MDNIDKTSTLRDIYFDYHLKLGEMKNDPATDAITLKHISDIYAVDSEKIYDNGYMQFPLGMAHQQPPSTKCGGPRRSP